MRRAGFGATPDELDRAVAMGYDAMVDELLNPGEDVELPIDLIRRYFVEQSDLRNPLSCAALWMYRMVLTETPLREKMCLFWHRVFATASYKLIQGRVVLNQIDMFRNHGMGRFDTLLLELSKDPAMLMWLDNQDNHAHSINENYGREILELFAMGVGNYTEDDIKECARAFTGWRVVNPDYMSIKMRNNTARPYGYISWQFEYDDEDHDHGDKTLLGVTGDLNGEDAVDIISRNDATPRFIARHLYHYFVADEPGVPQWPHVPPRDPQLIQAMVDTYFETGYSIKEMLRTLFTSDSFKSEAAHYARIKSPAEMVVGTMRLAGGLDVPSRDAYNAVGACAGMGQLLLQPPSVEGWQGGEEWINTGAYVQRVNFASATLDDPSKPGIRSIIDRLRISSGGNDLGPVELVDACLKILGPLPAMKSTRQGLINYASKYGTVSLEDDDSRGHAERAIAALIGIIVATQEYQMV
jgi:uncharacterized protein (DUF1800 family)